MIEDRLGLHYTPADREILRSKLTTRAVELGFDSLLDYYYFLKYDPANSNEMAALADALVVNETYFFREAESARFRDVLSGGTGGLGRAAPAMVGGLFYRGGTPFHRHVARRPRPARPGRPGGVRHQ